MSKKNIIVLIGVFAVIGVAGYFLMKKEGSESEVKPETKDEKGFDPVKTVSNRQDMLNQRAKVTNAEEAVGNYDKTALSRNTNQYQ